VAGPDARVAEVGVEGELTVGPAPAGRCGLDAFNAANQLLDRAPKGRDEEGLPVPVAWLRRHDEYEPSAAGTGG